MKIKFYSLGEISGERFDFAVICAVYKGKWIFVRHKDRNTWEIPGGHREENEDINVTASRELFEETGAVNYEIDPVCDYSVSIGEITTFGRLFYAKVIEIGHLPESEICGVRFLKEIPNNLTYSEIQPRLQWKVLQHLSSKTLRLLEKDKTRNINIINFIKNYPVQTFDTVGDSVLVRGRSDEDWVYISSKSNEEFLQLIEGLDEEDKCFAVLEDWMLPYIVTDREIRFRLTSMKLVYDYKTSLPPVRSAVVTLSAADAPYIYENSKYKEYISIEYIEDRIKNGIALGIYGDGKLVAWAITHDDGAIGFLNVLEEYRGKGYGTDVTVAMIKRLLELGELPFVHIEEDNIKSMNLALKAGFRKDRRIHWIKLK
ncbi:GNAT family N-acetyltransferase [Clostridium cochlearium]|uniref:GNAT family N-acetyltransferase n=1 Tax=Clostridium cochlearium TaxID=1494 RepID=UPI00241F6D55|nr:GNAT family N-acetyltransferase [Clostridium cochlearium]MBE6064991.1 GNAT family N-acetyltransferase [Clostridium cochlearium]